MLEDDRRIRRMNDRLIESIRRFAIRCGGVSGGGNGVVAPNQCSPGGEDVGGVPSFSNDASTTSGTNLGATTATALSCARLV